MDSTFRLRRAQASAALWGGLLALVAVLLVVGFTAPGIVQLPVTTLMILLLGWGLRGELNLLAFGIAPGLATIGWLLAGPAFLVWWWGNPMGGTLLGLAATGLPMWLFHRVRGGHWLHVCHARLFARATGAEMEALLVLAVERVRDKVDRALPGGYTAVLTPQPGILRINGAHFEVSAQLSRSEDVEGATVLLRAVSSEITRLLGWRAWPVDPTTCHVRIDSAHTTLQRAARRMPASGVVALVENGKGLTFG